MIKGAAFVPPWFPEDFAIENEQRNVPAQLQCLRILESHPRRPHWHWKTEFVLWGSQADLYCDEVKIDVEIDGESHWDAYDHAQVIRDVKRELTLHHHGVKIIRFTNEQVFTEHENIFNVVFRVYQDRKRAKRAGGLPAVESANLDLIAERVKAAYSAKARVEIAHALVDSLNGRFSASEGLLKFLRTLGYQR